MSRRPHQGALPGGVHLVELGSVLHQQPHGLQVTGDGGQVQSALAGVSGNVDVGPELEQQRDHLVVAETGVHGDDGTEEGEVGVDVRGGPGQEEQSGDVDVGAVEVGLVGEREGHLVRGERDPAGLEVSGEDGGRDVPVEVSLEDVVTELQSSGVIDRRLQP